MLDDIKKTLWATADKLRANMDAAEYKHLVLGLIFVTFAVGRLIPGVVGNPESLVAESHEDGLLEYPSYTKPSVWRGHEVPPILLSGNHGAIAAWRREQQIERTAARRPDLLADQPNRAI